MNDGVVRVLPAGEPFPLIGSWIPGEKHVQLVTNAMYTAPIVEHAVKPSDFLLVFTISRRHGKNVKRSYLRSVVCSAMRVLLSFSVRRDGERIQTGYAHERNWLAVHGMNCADTEISK